MTAVPVDGPIEPPPAPRTRADIVRDIDWLILELQGFEPPEDEPEDWVLTDWSIVPVWDRLDGHDVTGLLTRVVPTGAWRVKGMLNDALDFLRG